MSNKIHRTIPGAKYNLYIPGKGHWEIDAPDNEEVILQAIEEFGSNLIKGSTITNTDGRTIVEFEGVIPKNTPTFQSIRESILMDENFTLTDLEQMCATYAHQRFGILKLEGCKMFQQVNSDMKELAKISSGSVMREYPHVTDYWMALLKEFTLRVNIEWETRNLTTQRI